MTRIVSWSLVSAIWFIFCVYYGLTIQVSRHPHALRSRSSESCETSAVLQNVTLRGGIKAGYFHKLAQFVAMELCVQLCCQEKGCDVAFMIGKNCYGVKCFSEDLCSVVPAKNAPKALMISKVDFRGEVYLQQFMPEKLRCFETMVEQNVTIRGGLAAGNFTSVGHAESIDACAKFCCVNDKCDLALLVNDNCFMVTCTNVEQCTSIPTSKSTFNTFIARVNRTKETSVDQQTVLALSSLPGKPSKLMCKNGIVQYNQTLLGGYEAGKFKTLSRSTNMSTCIRLCCGEKSCDVALMIEKKCYGVTCHSLKQCRAIPAKNSVMLAHLNPRISYITSRNEEVTSTMLRRQSEICTSNVISYDVTLRGGKHAGKYKTFGEVEDMQECIRICCMEQHCDVAFMISGICFTVRCYSDHACKEVHAPGTGYKPMLSYVVREKPAMHKTRSHQRKHRKQRNHKKHKTTHLHIIKGQHTEPTNTTSLPDIPHVPSPNLPSVDNEHYCTNSEIMYNVTLQGGIDAGKYRDRGVLPNMQECLRICCIATTCDLAFMLGNHCLSVTCKNQSLCEVVTARSSALNPRIAYIYARSTNTKKTAASEKTGKDVQIKNHNMKQPDLGRKNISLSRIENNFGKNQTNSQKKKNTKHKKSTKTSHHHERMHTKENLMIKKHAMKKLKQDRLSENKIQVPQATTETKITGEFRKNLTRLVTLHNNNSTTSDNNATILPKVHSISSVLQKGNYTMKNLSQTGINDTSKKVVASTNEANNKYSLEIQKSTSKKQKIAVKHNINLTSSRRKKPGGKTTNVDKKGVVPTLDTSVNNNHIEKPSNQVVFLKEIVENAIRSDIRKASNKMLRQKDILKGEASSYTNVYTLATSKTFDSKDLQKDRDPQLNKNTTLARLVNSSSTQIINSRDNGLPAGEKTKTNYDDEIRNNNVTNVVKDAASNNTDLILQDAFTFEPEGKPTNTSDNHSERNTTTTGNSKKTSQLSINEELSTKRTNTLRSIPISAPNSFKTLGTKNLANRTLQSGTKRERNVKRNRRLGENGN